MSSDLSLRGRRFRLWFTMFVGTIAGATLVVLSFPASGLAAEEAEVKPDVQAELVKGVTQGALRIAAPIGGGGGVVECPLTHTDVRADVTGFLARVHVTQTFKNPKEEPIEAVYVFPLPHQAAIDDMKMLIGERRIEGKIKKRNEARAIYEQALNAGQTAALLEQERPNIFTQSVGNIPPGATVRVEISYVDVLKYDQGEYEFSFPMVVGPRFNPGTPSPTQPLNQELAGKAVPGGAATTSVPDGDRINPAILKPGFRTGHDISLTVHLDAGVPVEAMDVRSHEASIERPDNRHAIVKLNEDDSIPNKDFVLRYDVVGEKPAMALLAHRGGADAETKRPGGDAGYFMLMIQPKEDERLKKSPPREIVFLVDVSGSMNGGPTAKVIETMQHMLSFCREGVDTVQVVTFASMAQKLFPAPVPVNKDNIARAQQFTANINAGGGTQMLEGVKMAMDEPIDPERVRIIIMLTDGYIGNEAQIIEHVGKRAGDQIRFWCIGIGASPNMFLVDGVAKQGGGMGKQLNLNDDAQPLAADVISRIQRAQLSNVKIDWGNLTVSETYPTRLPELWAGRPVIVFGRYEAAAGTQKVSVTGRVEGEPAEWPLTVELPANEPQHDVLAPTWARQKIEDLMQQAYYIESPAVAEAVTAMALDYRLMSQFTSFVAVDDSQPPAENAAAPPHRMLVPVPLPEGTRWEGFFGPGEQPRGGDKRLLTESLTRRATLDVRLERLQERGELSDGAENRFGFAPSPALGVPMMKNAQAGGQGGRQLASAFGGVARGGGGGAGGGGRGVAAPAARPVRAIDAQLFMATDAAVVDKLLIGDAFNADGALRMYYGPAENSEPLAKVFVWEQSADGVGYANALAAKSLAAGNKALEAKDAAIARGEFEKAIYFAEAQANRRSLGADAVSGEALAALEKLRQDQVDAWKKAAPKLATRLALVLRDVSVDEALAQIARASGVSVDVLPGSLEDAAALVDDPRVHYLDLRRATVAEALQWILLPARLTWQLDGNKVIVASRRRLPGASCWVYDVADMALPRHSELGNPSDQAAYLKNAGQQTDAFLAAVRKQLGSEAEGVQWFAPGQLLVVGDTDMQAKAAKMIVELADPKAAASSDLHKRASERLAARKAASAEAEAARAQLRALAAIDNFGWPLLSAAAAGRLDTEALTELEFAWKKLDRSQKSDVLQLLSLRTAWIAAEASRALPGEGELKAFAATLRADSAETGAAAAKALATSTDGPAASRTLQCALYAALARRDDAAFIAEVRKAVAASPAVSANPMAKSIVPVLLGGGGDGERAALADLIRSGSVRGEDAVVLTALACRRVGGDAWSTLRAESPQWLGSQPLTGAVVVFVNELSATSLPLVAAAR